MEPSVTTRTFRASQSGFLMTLAGAKGKIIVILTALTAAAGTAAGIAIDLRWLILALMVLMILAPMLLALLYISRGMMPLTALNLTNHTVEISDAGIRIFVFEAIKRESHDEPKIKEESESESENKEEEELRLLREVFIPLDRLRRYRADSSAITIDVAPENSFIILPYSSFKSEDDLRNAVAILRPASN